MTEESMFDKIRVRVTEYEVTAFPEEMIRDRRLESWTLKISYSGEGKWEIHKGGRFIMYKAASLDEALRVARQIIFEQTVNGLTVQDVWRKEQERDDSAHD